MKEIEQILNYDVNLDLLMQQYKDKPEFKKLIQAVNLQYNDLEQAIFEVRNLFWVTTAEGVQLDVLGQIQDIARNGLNDDDYRLAIAAKIIINNGSGEFRTLITELTELLGATKAQLRNMGNANLDVWVDILITAEQYQLFLRTVAAGVGVYMRHGSDNPFVFAGDPDGSGFSDINQIVGGDFQGLYTT